LEADFNRLGLGRLINQHLGNRNSNAVYSYTDVLKSLWLMFCIGSEVLDDLNTLRDQLSEHPLFTPCSPDRVEFVCRELKQPVREVTTAKGVKRLLCKHEGFNRLLPTLTLQGGFLSTTQQYVLVFDGHIAENTKCKKVKGQLTLEEAGGYRYHAVITNSTADPFTCIEFYNRRGCQGEHHFKEPDYDFSWNKLPFDNLAMNTIYLYATAVASVLFSIFKQCCAAKTTLVTTSRRIKNYILHVVILSASRIKTGRRYLLKLFTR
jgi:hypothetical protein